MSQIFSCSYFIRLAAASYNSTSSPSTAVCDALLEFHNNKGSIIILRQKTVNVSSGGLKCARDIALAYKDEEKTKNKSLKASRHEFKIGHRHLLMASKLQRLKQQ